LRCCERTGDKEPSAGNTGTFGDLLAAISVLGVLAVLGGWPLVWVLMAVALLLSLRGDTAGESMPEVGERIDVIDIRLSLVDECAGRQVGETENILGLSPVAPSPGGRGDGESASGTRFILP
jgi:hypothetical protein